MADHQRALPADGGQRTLERRSVYREGAWDVEAVIPQPLCAAHFHRGVERRDRLRAVARDVQDAAAAVIAVPPAGSVGSSCQRAIGQVGKRQVDRDLVAIGGADRAVVLQGYLVAGIAGDRARAGHAAAIADRGGHCPAGSGAEIERRIGERERLGQRGLAAAVQQVEGAVRDAHRAEFGFGGVGVDGRATLDRDVGGLPVGELVDGQVARDIRAIEGSLIGDQAETRLVHGAVRQRSAVQFQPGEGRACPVGLPAEVQRAVIGDGERGARLRPDVTQVGHRLVAAEEEAAAAADGDHTVVKPGAALLGDLDRAAVGRQRPVVGERTGEVDRPVARRLDRGGGCEGVGCVLAGPDRNLDRGVIRCGDAALVAERREVEVEVVEVAARSDRAARLVVEGDGPDVQPSEGAVAGADGNGFDQALV